MTLADLIEGLDEPSREVDAEIALLVHFPNWRSEKLWDDYAGVTVPTGCWQALQLLHNDFGYSNSVLGPDGIDDLLCYTASLDAAMTLVPEGWSWMAGNRDQPLARAYVNNGQLAFVGCGHRRNPNRRWFECTAATPALALCAAALRAQEEEER